MGQTYNWVDDYSTPNWVDDPPSSPKMPSMWDWFSTPMDMSSTTKPDPITSNYSDDMPGVPSQGMSQRGVETFGHMPKYLLYDAPNEMAKRFISQGKEGDIESAFGTITSPLTDPIKSMWDASGGVNTAKGLLPSIVTGEAPHTPSPEAQARARHKAIGEAYGMAGVPGEEFQKAWNEGDIEALTGYTAGAGAMFAGGHALGKAFEGNGPTVPPPPLEAHGPGLPEGFYPRGKEWIEAQNPQPVYGPELSPSPWDAEPAPYYGTRQGQPDLGFNDPVQGQLNLGPYRAPNGRMTNTGPARAPRMGPEVGEFGPPSEGPVGENPWLEFYPEQGDLLKDLYKQPPVEAPKPVVGGAEVQNARVNPQTGETVIPGVTNPVPPVPEVLPPPRGEASPTNPVPESGDPIFSNDRKLVTIPAPSQYILTNLRNQGYVSVPGLVDSNGRVMMARADVAGLYRSERPLNKFEEAMRARSAAEKASKRTIGDVLADVLDPNGAGRSGGGKGGNTGAISPDMMEDIGGAVRNIKDGVKEDISSSFRSGKVARGESHDPVRAELDAFIANGGETPPEARTSGITEKIQDTTNKLIERAQRPFVRGPAGRENQAGVIDIPALLAQLREFSGRRPDEPTIAPERQRTNDVMEVDNATTVERARDIRDFWRNSEHRESRNAEEAAHANAMYERARQRVSDLTEQEFTNTTQRAVAPPSSEAAAFAQRNNDTNEIYEAPDPERAIEIRNFWEEELQSLREDGSTTPDQIDHANRMYHQARNRAMELADAHREAVNPHRQNSVGQRADQRQIEQNNNLQEAFSHRDFWQREFERDSRAGDLEASQHAQRMLDLAETRTSDLGSGGDFEVFEYGTGHIVRRFQTENEARSYVDRNPTTDYENLRTATLPPIQVYDQNTGVTLGRFDDVNRAQRFIERQGNPTRYGYFDSRSDPHVVEPYTNDPYTSPELIAATEARHPEEGDPSRHQEQWEPEDPVTPPLNPTPNPLDGNYAILDYSHNSNGVRVPNISFNTPAEARAYISTLQNSHDYEYFRTSNYGPHSNPALTGPMHGPELATREELVNATRDEQGRVNPPVKLGLQPRRTEIVKASPDQVRRLEGTANRDTLKSVWEAQRKINEWRLENRKRRKLGEPLLPKPTTIFNDRAGWDSTMDHYWKNLPVGDPGLTITQPYRGAPLYDLEYRGPDGVGIAFARVREDANGVRTVPSLAMNKDAGMALTGRAANEIKGALIDMNALDSGQGVISQFTGRAIAHLVQLLRDEGGWWDISQELNLLSTLLGKTLKGMDKTKTTAMDVYAAISKDMPKGKDLKWIMDKVGVGKGESNPFDPVEWSKEKMGWGKGESHQPAKDEINQIREALAVPAGATTMLDLSAPGRQGLSLIATPEFWKAGYKMFKSLHYDTWKEMDAQLRAKDLMVKPVDPVTGKEGKSVGEMIGTKIYSPASEMGPRAEGVASRWLEMGVGEGVGSKAWRHSAGYPIRATNRAFITFLNELNVNRTERLMNLARDMSIKGLETGKTRMPGVMGDFGFKQKVTPDQAMDLNPYHNLVRGKEIADFVNTATGHGPLKTHLLPYKKAEVSLESAAGALGHVLFSPGLLASRVRMMNPNTYIMASPFVRKQYLKAALSTAAAWYVSAELLKKAAGPEAEVGDDPTSADFGKVRIGDARMDLSGGFAQFATAYARAYVGGATSSSTGKFHRFGSGYQAQTQEDMMQRFFVNKLNPTTKFAYDVASASEYNPVHMGDRTLQLFIPLFIQDLNEIAKENPDLLPVMGSTALFGGGTQIYGKGESVSKFIDPTNDWNVTGGGIRDVMPWNWGVEPGQETNLPFTRE
jgi:hypothetical protein